MALVRLPPQKFVSSMLLLTVENLNVRNWAELEWYKVHTAFHEKPVNQFKRYRTEGEVDTHIHTHNTEFP